MAAPLLMPIWTRWSWMDMNDHISWVGWQNNPFAYMRNSDVLLHSSRWEGFGNVLVEAMASGVPVVCTDCGEAIQSILQHGKAGLIVEQEDVDGMVEATLKLHNDPELRESILHNANSRLSEYEVHKIADQYVDLYLESEQAKYSRLGVIPSFQ